MVECTVQSIIFDRNATYKREITIHYTAELSSAACWIALLTVVSDASLTASTVRLQIETRDFCVGQIISICISHVIKLQDNLIFILSVGIYFNQNEDK